MIYLDHNATTPVLPEVLAAMQPYFTQHFGNAASSSHAYGWQAKAACELAREKILAGLGAPKGKVIFTSGATESNNLAIKGVAEAAGKPIHIITQVTEHACVLESCDWLAKQGHEVTVLPVDGEGFVNPSDLKAALKDNTALVSIMMANNEIGTLQHMGDLAHVIKENSSALFHTDAAQAVGKVHISLEDLHIDLLSFSGHKLYGPKGVGALVVNESVGRSKLKPQMLGGGHEEGFRSGTLNVPGVVGLSKALEMQLQDLDAELARQKGLRDHFLAGLLQIADVSLNGSHEHRLSNNINVWIKGVSAEKLILALPGLAFSTGSACASSSTEPSYVVQALGRSAEQAKECVRFGLGRSTTMAEVDSALTQLAQAIAKERGEA